MSTVVVTAPADLQEGFTFDAAANGKTFKVTVPAGGVKAGDEITVPVPTDEDLKQGTGEDGAPRGKFRNGLCDCFETCCCPFFMGWCCVGILTGQVLQRLRLNPIGMQGDHQNTCMIMTGIFFVCWLFSIIMVAVAPNWGYVFWYFFYIYVIVAMTLARFFFRTKYSIPGSVFGDSALDDCCCSFWCGCCTIIQMHRHTHDEKTYQYDMTSKTGLPSDAPEIV